VQIDVRQERRDDSTLGCARLGVMESEPLLLAAGVGHGVRVDGCVRRGGTGFLGARRLRILDTTLCIFPQRLKTKAGA
jgi:hypothetical protein